MRLDLYARSELLIVRRAAFLDVSALLASALARPINAMFDLDTDVARLRRRVRRRPMSAEDAGTSITARTIAWLMLAFMLVPIAVLLSLAQTGLPKAVADVLWTVLQSCVACCLLTGLLHSFRFGAIFRLADDEWRQARGLRKLLVTPGDVDVVVVLVLVVVVNILVWLG
jgi:hypothetical protein